MKLPLKNNNHHINSLNAQNGSTITLVLLFSAIGMITISSYLYHQMSFSRESLKAPIPFQALLNARSGIYKGLYQITDQTITDTLKTINTLDSLFGADMFDGQEVDTTPSTSLKPELNGTPVDYSLYSDSGTTNCTVTLAPYGGNCKLVSTGICKTVSRTVEAVLGCPVPAHPDTVALYHSPLEWSDAKPSAVVVHKKSIQSYNKKWYKSLIDLYQTRLTDTDSLILDPPLSISSSWDMQKLPSVINSQLLIDGSVTPVSWKDTGTFIVKSDLQITGDVSLSGMRFIVAGEIKILDESNVTDVTLYTSGRIFIGDQAVFSGNALALQNITVFGRAEVKNQSSLIAGARRSESVSSSDSLKFSILLAEECQVDAVCIALETPGGIKTDVGVSIQGILWAHHLLCHRGTMRGLAIAQRFVDCDDPVQMTNDSLTVSDSSSGDKKSTNRNGLVPVTLYNSIPGELTPLDEISSYHLPFFMGRLSLISWKELYQP